MVDPSALPEPLLPAADPRADVASVAEEAVDTAAAVEDDEARGRRRAWKQRYASGEVGMRLRPLIAPPPLTLRISWRLSRAAATTMGLRFRAVGTAPSSHPPSPSTAMATIGAPLPVGREMLSGFALRDEGGGGGGGCRAPPAVREGSTRRPLACSDPARRTCCTWGGKQGHTSRRCVRDSSGFRLQAEPHRKGGATRAPARPTCASWSGVIDASPAAGTCVSGSMSLRELPERTMARGWYLARAAPAEPGAAATRGVPAVRAASATSALSPSRRGLDSERLVCADEESGGGDRGAARPPPRRKMGFSASKDVPPPPPSSLLPAAIAAEICAAVAHPLPPLLLPLPPRGDAAGFTIAVSLRVFSRLCRRRQRRTAMQQMQQQQRRATAAPTPAVSATLPVSRAAVACWAPLTPPPPPPARTMGDRDGVRDGEGGGGGGE